MRGLNTAGDVVKYCKSKSMFREVNMKRFVAATTTRRVFTHVTRELVETSDTVMLLSSRAVSTFDGKDTFSPFIVDCCDNFDTKVDSCIMFYLQV